MADAAGAGATSAAGVIMHVGSPDVTRAGFGVALVATGAVVVTALTIAPVTTSATGGASSVDEEGAAEGRGGDIWNKSWQPSP